LESARLNLQAGGNAGYPPREGMAERGVDMIGRLLSLLAGLAAMVAVSQAPGFTLQYMVGLESRIAELKIIVDKFDGIAREMGVSRDQYVADLRAANRESTTKTADVIEDSFKRYSELVAHNEALTAASPLMRPITLAQTYMKDIAEPILKDYQPAVPATPEGFIYGGGGFLAGWALASIVFGAIGGIFGGGRRRH
jgi:hypothetical protein